ncbi:MAG: tRNA uridine-5-carboxymethylaminomethyl(34) synthesis GTPase MnmE [Coxiella-like endosymbiont]|uniref:tRNA uridine-5-carboxymethylaminomethyl(34) synthesis GTPase MnmE n=1 Tax=Coxiella-like endosymbiont TaxID=1592897 RepID=UPI00215AEA87|nr:tRNA uridine-5-carboxymethylaminomethyl(34) synthesis GTPase MnmE [Coxiella-like endosymbiont]UVE59408.1 tRNA uridine-5-carboxymethylaminomethyl(34) synthesis GTPase MnmE [Coxiella-like endosymbiont]
MSSDSRETIVAQITPSGQGGISVVRVSGPQTKAIAKKMLGCLPKPRHATVAKFKYQQSVIDEGIALYFPGPNSFTGEDVLELHGHGGPIVIDCLLKSILNEEVRLARPGEFSERAFLNNKIDLAQAEAISDLINATSERAAKSAVRSLQGEFSNHIRELVTALVELRTHVEAAIDFPEEEIDFLADKSIEIKLKNLLRQVKEIKKTAKQGVLLRDGITVVIAGEPNVGKSSLLNLLSGQEIAIVTDIAGTTRDVLRESIHIDGMPINILDTAGLRITEDVVEKEGMNRTKKAIDKADLILLMLDSSSHSKEEDFHKTIKQLFSDSGKQIPLVIIENKIDLTGEKPSKENTDYIRIKISVKTGAGIDLLKCHLKEIVGFKTTNENDFIARRRHCDSITRARFFLEKADEQFFKQKAGELIAEYLRQAQNTLSEITGEFVADDLLRKIFSEFCIGK